MTQYEKTVKLGVGDEVTHFDNGNNGHPVKWVNGKVTEIGEETFVVQWEDLNEPTEYWFSEVEINGNQIFDGNERTSIVADLEFYPKEIQRLKTELDAANATVSQMKERDEKLASDVWDACEKYHNGAGGYNKTAPDKSQYIQSILK